LWLPESGELHHLPGYRGEIGMSDLIEVTGCCRMPFWGDPRRCTGCGHRKAAVDGTPPRQTREQPFWTWPGELLGRFRARKAGGRR
jgi:hypothetical protein